MSEDATIEASAPQGETAPKAAGTSKQARLGLGVVVAFALVALFWPRSEAPREAPPGMLVDAGGRPVPLATRMAPVTLVHLWSTWCPPCLDEVPSIQRLEADYASNHDFSLVMIAVADDAEKVKTFLGDGAHDSLFDHEWKVSRRYGTDKLPETHLVVRGKIVHSFIGATDWDDPPVRRRIDEALASLQDETG